MCTVLRLQVRDVVIVVLEKNTCHGVTVNYGDASSWRRDSLFLSDVSP